MSLPVETFAGSLLGGDYRMERRLKQGGMGSIWVALQESTGQRRALKLMRSDLLASPDQRARFELEARVSGRIRSDHVVQVLGAGVDDRTGTPWIAMELLDGEDLGAAIRRRGAMTGEEVLAIFGQLCHALAAAHAAGVVHRDLKPENVFLETPRREGVPFSVKVLDFGIAKVLADAPRTTSAIGTPHWMAPEQTSTDVPITPAADLWPLGLLAFRLLTGKYYWRTANEQESSPLGILKEVALEPLVAASARAAEYGCADRLPPGFDAWFARCVAREPTDRFADAMELRAALTRVLVTPSSTPDRADGAGSPGEVPPPGAGATVPTRRVKATSPLAVVALAGLVLAAAGSLLAWWRMARPRPEAPVATAAAAAPLPSAAPSASEGGANGAVGDAGAAPSGPAGGETRWRVPIAGSPVKGSPAALVTIVEFANFQCPLSKGVDASLRRLLPEYGRDVRLVWKEDPLSIHPRAEAAATVAREALTFKGIDGFWEAHDRLFALQPDLGGPRLEVAAKGLGLNLADVRAAIAARRHEATIDADLDLADGLGVAITPTLFVNGRRLDGPRPYEEIKAVVDEELARARGMLDAGVAPADVYDEVLRRGRPPQPPERRSVAPPSPTSPFQGGGAEGQVVVQEFCDFEDPRCRRAVTVVQRLTEHYGASVLVLFRDAPAADHPNARLASAAAREAYLQKGAAGFARMQELLFDGQRTAGGLARPALERYAKRAGLDLAAFKAALDGGSHDAEIEADAKAAAAAGITVRPSFFIGPYFLAGMTSFRSLTKLVDRARAEGAGGP